MKGWNSQVPLTATQGRQSPDVDNAAINHYYSFLIRIFDICLLLFAINVLLSIFAYNAELRNNRDTKRTKTNDYEGRTF